MTKAEARRRRRARRRARYHANRRSEQLAHYDWRRRNPKHWKRLKNKYYIKHRLKILAKVKRWYRANRKRCVKLSRWRYLKREYGLTRRAYQNLLKIHKGRCGICNIKFKSKTDRHTDHCHAANKVRGLLCTKCNLGLGYVERDDGKWLVKAMAYLKRWK